MYDYLKAGKSFSELCPLPRRQTLHQFSAQGKHCLIVLHFGVQSCFPQAMNPKSEPSTTECPLKIDIANAIA